MSINARKWTWISFLTLTTLAMGVLGYLFNAAQATLAQASAYGRAAERAAAIEKRVEAVELRTAEHDRLLYGIDTKLGVIEERTRWLQSLRDGKGP